MCVHVKVIGQTLVFPRYHQQCSLRKSLALVWSWPSRLVWLVCEPKGYLGCLDNGSNPVSFLLWYNTWTSNHRGRVYCAYTSRIRLTNTEKSWMQDNWSHHICSQEQREWKHPCFLLALIKLLPVLHNLIPHLGNGASPTRLGLPTSINSQDNPSQTCTQANPV